MYQWMINRKSCKKGFTLVEVIVVLVILAILAAIMIPAMTGWIDKAKEKRVVVNARSFLLAAQACASEDYASNTTSQTYNVTDARIVELTKGLPGTAGTATADANGQIVSATYTEDITVNWTSASQNWVKGSAPAGGNTGNTGNTGS